MSVEDIGEAAATILLNPKGHVGKSYFLTGPRPLSGAEIARILTQVLQRPIQFVSPSIEETETFLSSLMAPDLVKKTLELYEVIRAGLVKHVKDDYIRLTGKQYITIEERYKQLKASGLLQ